MKSKKTLVLAASMFALMLPPFPHHAAASTTTTPAPGDSQMLRTSGDSKVKYMAVEQVAAILLSVLLP